MGVIFEIRRHAKGAIVPTLCACAIAYFGYHAVKGDRGLYAYARLSAEIQQNEAELAAVTAERQRLNRRALLLKPSGLDLDMLEEQARRQLGLAHPDDVIILTDD
jgi:cell division protein FtsB